MADKAEQTADSFNVENFDFNSLDQADGQSQSHRGFPAKLMEWQVFLFLGVVPCLAPLRLLPVRSTALHLPESMRLGPAMPVDCTAC